MLRGQTPPRATGETEKKKTRIKQITELLKTLQGSTVGADQTYAKTLSAEKDKLEAKKLSEDREGVGCQTATLEAKRDTLKPTASDAEAEVVRLENEFAKIAPTRAPPEAKGQPTLHDLLPAAELSVQQLGATAAGAGLDQTVLQELQGDSTTLAGALGRLREAAGPPPAAEASAAAPRPAAASEDSAAAQVDDIAIDYDNLTAEEMQAMFASIGNAPPPEAERLEDSLATLRGKAEKTR
ncbi:unnamed protein product, partial [Prorocentrum cordatum]